MTDFGSLHGLPGDVVYIKLLVPALYALIGVRLFMAGRGVTNRARKRSAYLFGTVFELCAVTGYLLPFLMHAAPGFGITDAGIFWSHVALGALTAFVALGRAPVLLLRG